ncbi:putative DNA-binding protein [Salisediminibacterium halotolerans]|uniref:putative DNA-binding protein n=1 Tax=Salisediminibacterium halotolerans TaxID=517425 RepID=UPI000EB54C60|nr:putative DNA-binding protein [Salisediminibacterium halotolerans]RLJ74250.1 hypothetical protein BCL39_1538 [Actinophytocola xinjiangensis]RPE87658.1 hypothetical protein EDD67_1394 [Salisediminibacterium halotolerans]TWG35087.1 hypothetical protein BCL52_1535 [Salisediminibacterium halotolerans]GEL06865.1 UPF0122 protein [Salisediminibacterium halotolerans]
MIEKTVRINYLYDFYQALLTEKQNEYMRMYYQDDWSLGEIAEYFQISRQAVYDNIRRTEAMLEDYEEKLRLFARFETMHSHLAELKQLIEAKEDREKLFAVIESLEKLE